MKTYCGQLIIAERAIDPLTEESKHTPTAILTVAHDHSQYSTWVGLFNEYYNDRDFTSEQFLEACNDFWARTVDDLPK